jgi:hypothetical protein
MKYRLSPGNAFFLFMLGIYIFYKTNPADPRDVLGAGQLMFFSVAVLIVDLLLQYFIKNYRRLVIVESIGLVLIIILTLAL